MKTSFVMLTWNRSPMLEVCLENLQKSIKYKDDSEIIIYDNNSPDNTKEVIEAFKNKHKDIKVEVIYAKENIGLKAYKKLFSMAAGDIIVEVDDDILFFPDDLDDVFRKYFTTFKSYGYLALDVIKNEHTTGAKPSEDKYHLETNCGLTVQKGPTGGWCTGFRMKDYAKIKFIFNSFNHYNFKHGEDGFLSKLFRLIGKKSGIIYNVKCFHATGPYYSKQFGLLERDIEKYKSSGREDLVRIYSSFK